MFPTKSGREFSSSFPKTAVHLYTQFLRIFAHLYHAHFRDILHLSLEAHLNVSSLSVFLIFFSSQGSCYCLLILTFRFFFFLTLPFGFIQSLFAHFLMFGLTFELLDPKECRAPREGWGFVVGDLMDVSQFSFYSKICC